MLYPIELLGLGAHVNDPRHVCHAPRWLSFIPLHFARSHPAELAKCKSQVLELKS